MDEHVIELGQVYQDKDWRNHDRKVEVVNVVDQLSYVIVRNLDTGHTSNLHFTTLRKRYIYLPGVKA